MNACVTNILFQFYSQIIKGNEIRLISFQSCFQPILTFQPAIINGEEEMLSCDTNANHRPFCVSETNASRDCNSIDLDCSNPNLLNYHRQTLWLWMCYGHNGIRNGITSMWNRRKPHARTTNSIQIVKSKYLFSMCHNMRLCVAQSQSGRNQYPFPH